MKRMAEELEAVDSPSGDLFGMWYVPICEANGFLDDPDFGTTEHMQKIYAFAHKALQDCTIGCDQKNSRKAIESG